MRHLHYIEIENFKRFGEKQRIELDHPAVLIGPNNCGKTTALQAIALWSLGLKTWWDTKRNTRATKRTGTPLNRLKIVAVPVQRTRYFWHQAIVRNGNQKVPLRITMGVLHQQKVHPVTMEFHAQGEEVIYASPDENTLKQTALLEASARLNVELLYPMSGLETEEPILLPGRIDVLLGQGQTAQVLRNLCLMVHRQDEGDWQQIVDLMQRLFQVYLLAPGETTRGSVDLFFEQPGSKEPLDVALAGRGFQQMLLIFAYLYSHKGSVLLVDEPDAHLEILRQKQIYVLLRDIATKNKSQIILVTHSEVILEEALDTNLTLILDGQTDDIAAKKDIKNALKHYGAPQYVRSRDRRHILYVEGSSDIDMLRALAVKIQHPVLEVWDEKINAFYTQNNYPQQDTEAELQRVEGAYGISPQDHFKAIKSMVPELRGLAILDNDGGRRQDADLGPLKMRYWRRYETENYFITPDALKKFVAHSLQDLPLFGAFGNEVQKVLDHVCLRMVFESAGELETWKKADSATARLIWTSKTQNIKLSRFAEEFFEKFAELTDQPVLIRKGEFHRLVEFVTLEDIPDEVAQKLDLLRGLFTSS